MAICILTDSLTQYPFIRFAGMNKVQTIEHHLTFKGQTINRNSELKLQQLPQTATAEHTPKVQAPSVADFQQTIATLLGRYDEILLLMTSSAISPAYSNALEVINNMDGGGRIVAIDTNTISVGVGVLVSYVARLIEENRDIQEVAQSVRSYQQHIYTLFNTPNLSYLYHNQLLDAGQAYVGEYLQSAPNFTIEDGRFFSTDKMRNKRHITDYLLEYTKEFEAIESMAFLHGNELSTQTSRLIREHVKEAFPEALFSEHRISLPLALLFGPQCQGVIVVDTESF
jgi:DegV family protein with EDD domain